MPGPGSRPAIAKPKNAAIALGRMMKYLLYYKLQLFIVSISIIVSAAANVAGTYFLKPIINEYIVPFIGHKNPDLSGFISILSLMGFIYILGVASTYAQSRLMLNISSGTLYRIRVDLFTHMESLPIKYFDNHTHGELMSRYTNDIDTLRQMISNGIPNLFSSALSVTGVFIMMLVLSPVLTILVVLMLVLMLFVIKNIGGKSKIFFKKQQKEIGKVNGFVEEIIEGQKVVKIFNHEEIAKSDFEKLNEELCKASTSANTLANILMPIMGNLSYVNYALTAAAGAIMTIGGRLDIGTIASFLQYTRSFSHPLTMISQQINSILSALAGAERIFEVLDEKPEADEGDVKLVYARKSENGKLEEDNSPTGAWAWKQHENDGSINYTEVRGDVRFEDVTFGYEEDKTVLNRISLYAKPGQK